jgi:hypothetical protein
MLRQWATRAMLVYYVLLLLICAGLVYAMFLCFLFTDKVGMCVVMCIRTYRASAACAAYLWVCICVAVVRELILSCKARVPTRGAA